MNHDECRCDCKEFDDWDSCKKNYMWNLSTCDCKCNKAGKIDEYTDAKNCSCEKRLIGKLVLECEDEVLNTTETSLNDKKGSMCKKLLSYSEYFICYYIFVSISCYLW